MVTYGIHLADWKCDAEEDLPIPFAALGKLVGSSSQLLGEPGSTVHHPEPSLRVKREEPCTELNEKWVQLLGRAKNPFQRKGRVQGSSGGAEILSP